MSKSSSGFPRGALKGVKKEDCYDQRRGNKNPTRVHT